MQQKIILLLLLLNNICFSQANTEQSFYSIAKPEDSGEEIILETDRQFYCIEERIYFIASYRFNYPVEGVHWSDVLYVELIRWNGEKITSAKFKLADNKASGYLTIPKTVLSGNYYLRAYTKWMRNFPAEEYAYSLVKIINPFNNEIDIGPLQEPVNQFVFSRPLRSNSYNDIECFTNKSTYKQREKVVLTIGLNNQDADYSNFCISVAKAAKIDTINYFVEIPDEKSTDDKTLIYPPEIRGISVSGKILNANTKTSAANSTVHLSTAQNWKYFTNFQTGEKGFFYFTIPDFHGQYDFYVDAVLEDGENADILIDNDYCNRNIHLSYIPFSLDTIDKKVALEMAVNMQLFNIYDEEDTGNTSESLQLPFYGAAKKVYYTQKYIQLPNLEEFFYELVKEVRTIRIDKQTHLKLAAYSQYDDLMPLILLDNIPVYYVSDFLKTPLDRIEKIEIVEKPYIVAGEKYSGIISVSTRRKDFAGIRLNKNSQFFSYNLLSEGNFNLHDYSSADSSREANMRNLLFWNPDIELNPDSSKTLSFYTSDSPGDYIVYVRSISPSGKPQLYGTCKLVVE